MENNDILALLPYDSPFLFVDKLLEVHQDGAKGMFHFKEHLDFYQGHFKKNPVTPGGNLNRVLCADRVGMSGYIFIKG